MCASDLSHIIRTGKILSWIIRVALREFSSEYFVNFGSHVFGGNLPRKADHPLSCITSLNGKKVRVIVSEFTRIVIDQTIGSSCLSSDTSTINRASKHDRGLLSLASTIEQYKPSQIFS